MTPVPVTLVVNGVRSTAHLDPHRTLLSVLRTNLGVTGPKEGCDDSECGACMVLLNGSPVNSCSYLAVQADGFEVTTVEGIGDPEALDPVQRELLAAGGVQCGFCTPGIVVSATALLESVPRPDEEQVRVALAGNLCRCTGYQKIVAAVLRASRS
ncbi:(2Fe-2S)-binding protein [Pseudonocardia sp. KRD-184]|uniref:(2Fe-2S)-binding protein n=1 Tax=Pseudonocardia oceani TaxID=2792013 RepID=A0ABS6UDA8_9PSEU|nr:(2Fe-2S)-binding protein [Pseudonocardia oceani]MBW0089149.1 (2Fe-2S)-binding protein [Pseudonocardia oceani]MBW0095961.1 (2Fe-2S)-binding protein [Pseudonocardia oceani]MBW0108849.1 (2Fe-2S)-binding protein [Pseudonocardia oceani]MBW0120192.1 (2Fe-2S)-binding protein [Pseudonocardia oceani]MBW0130236.1 (2Fe-2S)-binding protein [Pseudonocardia oceani]